MNLREYVAGKLRQDGYDGLASDECEMGCNVEDLMPCGEASELCVPAYWRSCSGCTTKDECDWDEGDVDGCYVAEQGKS